LDFWDLTKLLVRRWLVAVPLLMVSAALTVLTVGHVKPDYVATAYVQLVPPVTPAPPVPAVPQTPKVDQPTPEQRNPWLGLGLTTLGNAAIVTVQDQTVLDTLKAGGYSDSFTVTMGSSSPLITFEIVGKTDQQARGTAEQLVAKFNQSVAALQTAYGVSTADSITARRLDLGTNVKKADSKVKRALVAVAGAGLLMTAALTVGVDAWLRRRVRRRRAADVAPSAPTAPVSGLAMVTPPDATRPDATELLPALPLPELPLAAPNGTNGVRTPLAEANGAASTDVAVGRVIFVEGGSGTVYQAASHPPTGSAEAADPEHEVGPADDLPADTALPSAGGRPGDASIRQRWRTKRRP
jgi:hypothetical protein